MSVSLTMISKSGSGGNDCEDSDDTDGSCRVRRLDD